MLLIITILVLVFLAYELTCIVLLTKVLGITEIRKNIYLPGMAIYRYWKWKREHLGR